MKKKIWIVAGLAVLFLVFFRKKSQAQERAEGEVTKDEIISYVLNRNETLKSPFKPSSILAIIEQESGFNVAARGSVGESGLMQLTSGAVSDVRTFTNISGTEDYQTDWRANITAGIGYLIRLQKVLKDNNAAIRAYNAWDGTTAAFVAGNKGAAYLKSIQSKAEVYKKYD